MYMGKHVHELTCMRVNMYMGQRVYELTCIWVNVFTS